MNRRDFLCGISATPLGAALVSAAPVEAKAPPGSPEIGPGPHLLIDDFLIARSEGLERRVRAPIKLPAPVLDSTRFGTTQPYLSVTREPETLRYRMWYNHGPAIWHATSEDALRWVDPRVAWDIPRGYCCSILDDQARDSDPGRRFKAATWQSTKQLDD